jgi:hypothetical protein
MLNLTNEQMEAYLKKREGTELYNKAKTGKQLTIYDIFTDTRELTKQEKANINKKKNYINADWFRFNLFSPKSRGSHKKYPKYQPIFRSEKTGVTVSVSHELNQKHADLLHVLFSNCRKLVSKKNGTYYTIHTTLYELAKLLQYKNPKGSVHRIKKLLDQIRTTDIQIDDPEQGRINFTILGDSKYSNIDDSYTVDVGDNSIKVFAMSTAMKPSLELNQEIIALGDNNAKLKAVVRFLISNKPSKKGFHINTILEKFSIGYGGTKATNEYNKSIFLKKLKEKKEWLAELGIVYNEFEQKIYNLGSDVKFELGINPKVIAAEIIESENSESGTLYIGKYIKLNDNQIVQIKEIEKLDDTYFKVNFYNHKLKRNGTIKQITKEDIEKIIDTEYEEYVDVEIAEEAPEVKGDNDFQQYIGKDLSLLIDGFRITLKNITKIKNDTIAKDRLMVTFEDGNSIGVTRESLKEGIDTS